MNCNSFIVWVEICLLNEHMNDEIYFDVVNEVHVVHYICMLKVFAIFAILFMNNVQTA